MSKSKPKSKPRSKVISVDTGADDDFDNRKDLLVFTDGSCSRNGKANAIGGIGIHFPDGDLPDISKIFPLNGCTNQRTELYAILSTLRYVKETHDLNLYNLFIKTDSEYSINCLTRWAPNWVRTGWVKKDGKPVLNRDLIETIYKYMTRYHIYLQYVPAHTGKRNADAIGNAKADTLATQATKKAIEESKKLNRTLLKRDTENLKRKIAAKNGGSKSNVRAAKTAARSAVRPAVRPTARPAAKQASATKTNLFRLNKKEANDLVVELVKSK